MNRFNVFQLTGQKTSLTDLSVSGVVFPPEMAQRQRAGDRSRL